MYLLHNHPSGNHKPSLNDLLATINIKRELSPKGVNLIGHLIIDDKKFSYINIANKPYTGTNLVFEFEDYLNNEIEEIEYKNAVPKLFTEREKLPFGNDAPKRLMEISKALLKEKGYKGAIIYLSPNLNINAYDVFPENSNQQDIIKISKDGIENHLGSRLAFVHDGSYNFTDYFMPDGTLDVINTQKGISEYYKSEEKKEITEDDIITLWDEALKYRSVEPFYSPTERALESIKQKKGTPDQMKAMLLKNGAKQAELDWMGWDDFVNKEIKFIREPDRIVKPKRIPIDVINENNRWVIVFNDGVKYKYSNEKRAREDYEKYLNEKSKIIPGKYIYRKSYGKELFQRNQDSPNIEKKYSSYHFAYEPGLRHIYKNPKAYDEVDRIYKEKGYLEEAYVVNNYNPDDFKLKDEYVVAIRTDEYSKPAFIGGSASDDYSVFFEGEKIADVYDGVIVKPTKIHDVWKGGEQIIADPNIQSNNIITKAEIQEWIDENKIKVEEVKKGTLFEPESKYGPPEKPQKKDYPLMSDYLNALEKYYKEVPKGKEKPKEKVNYQQAINNLKNDLKPYYGRGTAGEKARQTKRRKIIEQFIRENRDDLKKLYNYRIPPALNAINKAARTNKGLMSAIAKLEKAINDSLNGLAKKKADKFIKDITAIETAKTEGGIIKAVNFLQEGIDYRDAIVQITQTKGDQLDDLRDAIDSYSDSADETANTLGIDDEMISRLAKSDIIHSLIDTYGNLRNKKLSEVEKAIAMWDENFKELKAQFRKFREKELKRKQELQDKIFRDVSGEPTEFEKKQFEEITSQKQRSKAGIIKEFQKLQGTIASFTHAIWRGYTEGKPAKDFFKSNLYELYKAVDRGASAKAGMQYAMKAKLDEYISDIWDSNKAFRKELKEDVEITLLKPTVDNKTGKEKDVPRKIKINTDSAAHLWASWQSEANKPYMEKIEYQKEIHKMTEDTFKELDEKLSDNIKNFTTLLTTDYYGNPEYYTAVNDVLKRKTGRDLPQLTGYIPVNANRYGNHIPYEVTNLGIYRSIVKERRYGLYDIDRNGIFNNAFEYADKVSSFAHLSEAVSDMAYTLNSRKVQSGLTAMGTNDKAQQIIDLLNRGYNLQREPGSKGWNWLMRRFVSTKILMNYNLLPKQLTSVVAMLDSDFGNPADVAMEFSRWMTGTSNKEVLETVKEILHNHPDLKFRNIIDIESLTKKQRRQPHVHMFGTGREDIAKGMLVTTLWNPTAVGDRIAIQMGGIPIAVHNYKVAYKYAKDVLNRSENEAKSYAAQAATDMLMEFINTTQQSAKITHKSLVQYGHWRMFTAFMNTVMGYQRKVTRHARDVNRDYQAGKKRLIDQGEDPIIAGAKAIGSINFAKVISLLIYTSLLPVLFDTVTSLGGNIARLWDDDDEKRKKARWNMLFQATLGWTKGLFGIGFVLEYALNQMQGISYGKRDDNIVPVLDDSLDLLDAIIRGGKLVSKYNDETIKDRSEYEQQLYKSMAKVGITGGGLFLGMPVTFFHRAFQVLTEDEYNNTLRAVARLYGMPKKELERIFDAEEQHYKAIIKKAKKFEDKLDELYETDYKEYEKLKDSNEWKIYRQILDLDKYIKKSERQKKDYEEIEDVEEVERIEKYKQDKMDEFQDVVKKLDKLNINKP